MLRDEVVGLLAPVPTGWVVDATVGGGGHSDAILEHRADLRVLAVDRDPAARAAATARLARHGDRARVVAGLASGLDEHALDGPVVGVLFDLGVSSHQIDEAARGFSYGQDGPLDMRMDPDRGETAADLLARLDEDELARMLRQLGDEPRGRRIARAVKAAIPIDGTARLARVVRDAVGHDPRRGDPAKRTFQALRMVVNDELGQLEAGLEAAGRVIVPGGRLVVIAYHSGEDRIVKRWLRRGADPGRDRPRGLPVAAPPAVLTVLTPRPLRPGPDEATANPRAASARLRAAEWLPPPTDPPR